VRKTFISHGRSEIFSAEKRSLNKPSTDVVKEQGDAFVASNLTEDIRYLYTDQTGSEGSKSKPAVLDKFTPYISTADGCDHTSENADPEFAFKTEPTTLSDYERELAISELKAVQPTIPICSKKTPIQWLSLSADIFYTRLWLSLNSVT
jgi:hypothetical protein